MIGFFQIVYGPPNNGGNKGMITGVYALPCYKIKIHKYRLSGNYFFELNLTKHGLMRSPRLGKPAV
jgi:hypothetical protein